MGGEILFIEASRMPGSGELTLTGQLGDVMKESAQIAFNWLRSNATRVSNCQVLLIFYSYMEGGKIQVCICCYIFSIFALFLAPLIVTFVAFLPYSFKLKSLSPGSMGSSVTYQRRLISTSISRLEPSGKMDRQPEWPLQWPSSLSTAAAV